MKKERKKRMLSTSELADLEYWSALGMPMHKIAAQFAASSDPNKCMSRDQLHEVISYQDAARHAVLRGRSTGSGKAHSTAYEIAFGKRKKDKNGKDTEEWLIPPDPRMMIFWLRTREGFKYTDKIELTGPDGGPIETVATPLTEKQKRELIERQLKRLQKVNEFKKRK